MMNNKLRYYLASSLENIEQVKRLHELLRAQGHACTYNWTVHGPVYRPTMSPDENEHKLGQTCSNELQGVIEADVIIGLLPGGRGTHWELGAASATGKRLILAALHSFWPPMTGDVSPWPCGFYYMQNIERISAGSEVEMFKIILEALR